MGTKESLLGLLNEKRGEFVSGSYLADRLGVSGTAIWKAANTLRRQGFMIDAVTNRGYRLAADTDLISASAIASYYESGASGRSTRRTVRRIPLKIEVFDTVGSTNTICRDRAANGENEVYVAIAGSQTAGRGRNGRTFFSPEGTGLYMSMLLRPSGMNAEKSLRFTTAAAAAAACAIEEVSGRTAGIKWVNDVYMGGRKVCGILTEGSFDLESGKLAYAIVGVGINVRMPAGGFPAEIRDTAGAICAHAERLDRNRLAAAFLRIFMDYYRSFSTGNYDIYMKEYRQRSIAVGRNVSVINPGSPARKARVTGIDDECHLLVTYEDGTEDVLSSGEISIKL